MSSWVVNFTNSTLVPLGLAVAVAAIVFHGVRIATGGARGFAEGIVAILAVLVGVFLILGHEQVLNAMKAAVGGG